MPFPSDKQREAFFAQRNRQKAQPRRVPLGQARQIPTMKLGQLLHDNGEHRILIVEDSPKANLRIYEIHGHPGRIDVLGAELDGFAKWWRQERKRKGTDTDTESQPKRNSALAKEMGYADALNQIEYVRKRGGSLAAGIAAHRTYCAGGDLFTGQHGDDNAFLNGAAQAYNDLRAKQKGGQR
jgi:hypothetical protein